MARKKNPGRSAASLLLDLSTHLDTFNIDTENSIGFLLEDLRDRIVGERLDQLRATRSSKPSNPAPDRRRSPQHPRLPRGAPPAAKKKIAGSGDTIATASDFTIDKNGNPA